jgi:hypothetical protein
MGRFGVLCGHKPAQNPYQYPITATPGEPDHMLLVAKHVDASVEESSAVVAKSLSF